MPDNDFNMSQAIAEAKRCLNCKVPQCKRGCPISNDIPEWIHQLSLGNLGNAIAIINARSNLPAVCGRVCAHERQCQGHCVLGKKSEPVQIGKLERFISDFASEMQLAPESIPAKTRGSVAVIGSGPAGLTVAGALARDGFDVEIFEMEPEPGGVLRYGIPEYRLPNKVVDNEIDKIRALGVRVTCNATIGPDLTVDNLFERGFDAVFMGTGAGKPKWLDFEGADNPGVRQAVHFLRRVALFNSGYIGANEIPVKQGDRVYVIGCGNTAMDAARSAIRLGASCVKILYHRTINEMKALRAEYDEAVEEGVLFRWNAAITGLTIEDGAIRAINYIKDGEAISEPADKVILAVGSGPAARIVSSTEGIDVDDKGYVLTRDEPYGMTTRPGVFAGGDVTNRPATVVHAMQDARRVAEGIERYVDAVRLLRSL